MKKATPKKKVKKKAKRITAEKPGKVIVQWGCMDPADYLLNNRQVHWTRASAKSEAMTNSFHTEVVRVTIERF